MKTNCSILLASALVLLFCSFTTSLLAQPRHIVVVEETIVALDSAFWVAYNNCDTEKMNQFVATDVEFYHDKGGPTFGLTSLSASIKNNLCGNPNFRLRREAVKGSVKVYPLAKDGVPYGAIIAGSHTFTILEKGKKERLDGLARFTHLWILENEAWKMKRILSYDHGPASSRTEK
ncbi:nuclear transport factor 2 family protein [Pontibacter qinzhouensis]|uniref:Nuclear transport factor 2 family protein n=1 Tax=Pontibacter qinzhouensis TaxID=2603253 RepID=A0A5C8J4K8_9BACT|nr:nuclear transport factor 2 family protein [Pontibacter qinzhouensis]TXK31556.1 nuclear transport factor 2 family protein [Pontibacter qinzhouensis]